MNAAALHQGLLAQNHLHGFAQRLGPINHHQQLSLSLQAAGYQIFQQPFDDGGILGGSMPQAQNVLSALQINADGRHQAIAAKELAVEHQRQQLLGDRPLHQSLQFLGRGSRPVPAYAGALYPIACQTALNGTFIVTRGALPGQLLGHRLLQFAPALKSLVAGQLDLLFVRTTQPWPLQCYFAASEDHVTWLMAIPPHRLLAPLAGSLLDLGFHNPLNDRQTQLGGEAFHVFAHASYQLIHRQLSFQRQSFLISCFFFGLCPCSAVFSHRWFSWLFVYFLRPSILFDGRQENHFHFQLPQGQLPAARIPPVKPRQASSSFVKPKTYPPPPQ